MPFSVDFAPISGRRPGLIGSRRKAVGQPQIRTPIAAIAHEGEPLAVGHQIAGGTSDMLPGQALVATPDSVTMALQFFLAHPLP